MHTIRTRALAVLVISLLAGGRVVPVASQTASSGQTPDRPAISLHEAVETALNANQQIRAAAARVRRSEAGVLEMRSSVLPDVVAIGEYTRAEKPTLVNPMHGTPTPTNPLNFDNEIYTGVLRLDVPILNLPARYRVTASRRQVDVQRARRTETEQRIIAAVAEIFVHSGQIRDNITLLDRHILALERRLTELRTLSQAGRVPPAAVSESEANLQSLRAERVQLRYRQDELSFRLAPLLGQDRVLSPAVPDFREAPSIGESADRTGAIGPAGQAAEAQYHAAEVSHTATQTSFAPRIDGFASQSGRSGGDLDFTGEWTLGLTVTVPLFTGGERLARLNAAEADIEAARHHRESVRTADLTEARLLRRRWESAAQRGRLLAAAATNQERSVVAAEDRFAAGRASLSDLLTEETTLLELKMHQQSTRYDKLLAYIAYAEITGELSPAVIASLIEE